MPQAEKSCSVRQEREIWYDSAPGSFALLAQKALVRYMIAVWPRRGRSLVEFFCGSGHFMRTFWESGLDVTGQEQNPDLAALCSSRLGARAELIRNNPEQLPFNDGSFDYAACLGGLEFSSNPELVLKEMLRVSTRGLLLGFRSCWSLNGMWLCAAGVPAAIAGRVKKKDALPDKNVQGIVSPYKVWMLTRQAVVDSGYSCRMRWGSVLGAPAWTWSRAAKGSWAAWPDLPRKNVAEGFLREGVARGAAADEASKDGASGSGPAGLMGKLYAGMNLAACPLPVGAYSVLRVDLAPPVAGNLLLLPA